jgi:hypothetical protein
VASLDDFHPIDADLQDDSALEEELFHSPAPDPIAGGSPTPDLPAGDETPIAVAIADEEPDALPGVPEFDYIKPGDDADAACKLPFGTLRYYMKTKTMVAHCSVHAGKCRLTRSVIVSDVAGREGQGRCLGYLVAWLRCCPKEDGYDRNVHVHAYVPTLAQRMECREWFNEHARTHDDALQFLRRERCQRDGEALEAYHVP